MVEEEDDMDRREEIAIKERRLRSLMDSLNLKGVLLKRQPNFSWFTAGGKNMVPISTDIGFSSLLITEKEKFCVANTIEKFRNMEEEGLEDLGFSLLDYEWYEGSELETVEKVLPLRHIGCDIPLEDARLIGDDINRLRYSLTQAEIERYLWLGEKTARAVETVLQEMKPGDTEAEITGELARLLWKDRIDQVGYQAAADDRVFKYRHPIPTERKVEKYVMLCVMSRKWGLHTTITRLMRFGKIPDKLRKQYEDNVFIECSMIAATRPGAKTADIFVKARKLYEELGYPGEWKLHHQGGAMGYDIRDYICTADSTEKVQENQCFCWNPSISGTKSEDAVIVNSDGFEFVTKPVLFPTLTVMAEGTEFTRPDILER
jgi:Xaa-Pro dipeptidase